MSLQPYSKLLTAYQPSTFLAFSLPCLSHHPLPSFLVVGPHRSLLSPGPLVTINNQMPTSTSATHSDIYQLPTLPMPPFPSGSAKKHQPPTTNGVTNHSGMEHSSKTPPQLPQLHLDQRSGKGHTWGNMEIHNHQHRPNCKLWCTRMETGSNKFIRLPLINNTPTRSQAPFTPHQSFPRNPVRT